MFRRVLVITSLAASALVVSAPLASAATTVDGSDIVAIGAAPAAGSLLSKGIRPASPVLGLAADATGNGYWMVAGDGGIFAFGDAPFKGSMGGKRLNKPMVGMAATPDGGGYWMFAADGGVFSFGSAEFYGSTGSIALNKPIVGMTPTATGKGYWMVAADGGVFAYGDAVFAGSTGSAPPSSSIVALAPVRSGNGYWIVTESGQVIAFGDAAFHGDLASTKLSNPVVGMAVSPSGNGYWLAQQDGQTWAFGDAAKSLATPAKCLSQLVVGVAARPQGDGLWLVTAPFSAPSVAGLAPLTALDRENDDLQARIAQQQACQSQQSTSSLNPFADVLPGSHISSAYGQRIHPIYHLPQFHRGVDLAGGSTLIRAFAAGTVIQVESRLGYGTTTVIDHGGRLATVYAHQSATKVKVGDVVVAGQVIGVVGHTGFATGPHLHFEMRLNGVVTDPTPLVPGHAASGGGPVG